MNTLFDLFQNHKSLESISYNAPNPYTGSISKDDHKEDNFEFILKIDHNLNLNVKHLSFYIKETPYLYGLIKTIIQGIETYKKEANRVSTIMILADPNSETFIGTKDPTFSNNFTFYTENDLLEQEISDLNEFCNLNGCRIKLRSPSFLEHHLSTETVYAFISHDSRDKALIAKPIADALNARVCPVWYDDYSLEPGQSLRESIEKGIKEAKKCILILTKNFLNNPGWGKKEFDSIFTRELVNSEKIIIPIWYGVTSKEIFEYSPSLANQIAIHWPQKRGKKKEIYQGEVNRVMDKLYNILKKQD